MESGLAKDYGKINDRIRALVASGKIEAHIGTAKEPVPVKIESVNKHALKHGVTREEAQGYIDNAEVMFDQGNRSLFVSREGNAVLLDNEKRLISAYSKNDFYPGIKAILEVLDNE